VLGLTAERVGNIVRPSVVHFRRARSGAVLAWNCNLGIAVKRGPFVLGFGSFDSFLHSLVIESAKCGARGILGRSIR
jgi:hypothetical protein